MSKAAAKKKTKPKTGRERAAALRARKRAQGLRLVQFWVPDIHSPQFLKEARRQSLMIATSAQEKDDQAFVDSLVAEVWQDIEREEG